VAVASRGHDAPVPYLAVLSLGAVKLCLPQNEIRTLEPVLDLREVDAGLVVGVIEVEDGEWPVFCLSEDLVPQPELPIGRRVCVLLGHGEVLFGLACERVESLQAVLVRSVPVPEAVAREGSAIRSLGLYGEEILCMSSTRALAQLLESHGCLQPAALVGSSQSGAA
jgi:CheW-like protein